MASIGKLQAGQIVWTVINRKMGNTTLTIGNLYSVKIIEVNVAEGWVIASLNMNPAAKYYSKSIKKWKIKKPEPKRMVWGTPSY